MTDFFMALFRNECFVTAVLAWVVAAFAKVLIEAVKSKQWDWERLLGPGGMPSTHTTPVIAVSASIGLVTGFDTPLFAISSVFCFIVAYDAAGIRRHSGEQAKAINNLIEDMSKVKPYKGQDTKDFLKRWNLEELETLLGHNPFEVAVGVALGIATTLVMHFQFGHLFQ